MPGGDLTAIAGLQESHRRALASKLGITTLQALADADQRTVHAALKARLRINRATIIDSVHEVDVINAGETIAVPPVYLRHPVRLRLTVGGGRPGQHLWAAVWFPLQAAPGWSPHDPVSVSATGQAEFDLSSVPPATIGSGCWPGGTEPTPRWLRSRCPR